MKKLAFIFTLLLQTSLFSTLPETQLIKHYFTSYYGPLEYKQQTTAWNLQNSFLEFETSISKDPRWAFRKLFLDPYDYHVGIYFFSTQEAQLPFELYTVDGKFLISWVDASLRSYGLFLQEGDEVLLWNGKPMDEVLKSFFNSEWALTSMGASELRFCENYLTRRVGDLGMKMPEGKVTVKCRSKQTGKTYFQSMNWSVSKEFYPSFGKCKGAKTPFTPKPRFQDAPLLERYAAIAPFFSRSLEKAQADLTRSYRVGSRRGPFPFFGKPLWQTSDAEPIFAYIFMHPETSQLIGYLRLNTFAQDEKIQACMESVLGRMQKTADALILDVSNNPGGSIFALYSYLSMLSDVPMKALTQREKISVGEMTLAVGLKESLKNVTTEKEAEIALEYHVSGYPKTLALARDLTNYAEFVLASWEEGNVFLDSYPILGIETIAPHKTVRYTKPLFVLINEMSFSCGDLMPAVLKDNDRAVLVGNATAGAGGVLTPPLSFPNTYGIESITLTRSLVERRDGSYIENQGVAPDYPYTPSFEEVQTGSYKGLKSLLLELIAQTKG